MVAFEKEQLKNPAELSIVMGDVGSTIACYINALNLYLGISYACMYSIPYGHPHGNRFLNDYFITKIDWAGENWKKAGNTAPNKHSV